MKLEPIIDKVKEKAYEFNGELFWKYDDVVSVIDSLSADCFAVIGVEIYELEGVNPKWLGSSDYSFEIKDWKDFVSKHNARARDYIVKNSDNKNYLYNLSIISESEL